MVIGPGGPCKCHPGQAVSFHVILSDGEFIPEKFNVPNGVVYRKGWMTFGELSEIKPLNELAKDEDLNPAIAPVCNYDGNGNPLHQHEDGTWWYFEETWSLENGPFQTEEAGHASLLAYCEDLQKSEKLASGDDLKSSIELLEKFGLTKKSDGE